MIAAILVIRYDPRQWPRAPTPRQAAARPDAAARTGREARTMPNSPMEVMLAGTRLRVAPRSADERAFWETLALGVQSRGVGGGWEDETLAFVAARARPGVVFVDIGAWIGPVSLLAARLGARVVALEPDPVARASLEENFALNGLRAEVIPAALHSDGDGLTLYGGRKGLGASMTSALGVHRGEPVHVSTVTPAEVADRAGPGAALMKVDIEGHEYAMAPRLAELRARLGGEEGAALHLSLHPRQLWKKLRRDWTLFARRKAFEATREALAAFGDAPMRVSGETEPLTPERLRARFGPGYAGNRNFAVEIGG